MAKNKLKTHRGAKKRFKKTAGGFKCKQAFTRHILTKKTTKQKRNLRGTTMVRECDEASVAQMLPHL